MFSVRPALAADIPRIIELNDALFRENANQSDSTIAPVPSRHERSAYFSTYIDSEAHIIFLAESDGDTAVIGYLAGGTSTIRQYLSAGLINELHLAISPLLLGKGEHLLTGIDTASLGYKCTEHVPTERAMHVILSK